MPRSRSRAMPASLSALSCWITAGCSPACAIRSPIPRPGSCSRRGCRTAARTSCSRSGARSPVRARVRAAGPALRPLRRARRPGSGRPRLRVHERARLRRRGMGTRSQPARAASPAVRGPGGASCPVSASWCTPNTRERSRRLDAPGFITCGRGTTPASDSICCNCIHIPTSGIRSGTPTSTEGPRPRSACGTACILGEFPGNGPAQHPDGAAPPATTLGEYLEFAVNAGYAGAWPWSFSGTDGYGRLPEEPLRDFALRHPELVNPRARTLTSIELLDRGDRRRPLLLQPRGDLFGAAHHAQHVQSQRLADVRSSGHPRRSSSAVSAGYFDTSSSPAGTVGMPSKSPPMPT